MNYYNENDPFAAEWLRQLIKANQISEGTIDERSIEDVRPNDLVEFNQCHFFAGIGGWSHALRQAGWPDDRPVWTGSCPCQPFSTAGKRGGTADERHLWPAFFHLVRESAPGVLFGEQVASKDGLAWFDTVQADLESAAYACWAWDLCAASIGAPHIRQRLYFVAQSVSQQKFSSAAGRFYAESGKCSDLGNSIDTGLQGFRGSEQKRISKRREAEERYCASASFWGNCDWLSCIDGKARPVELGTFPLAHGVSNRVGRLRGYGNAIVAPLAQAFIESYLEVTNV